MLQNLYKLMTRHSTNCPQPLQETSGGSAYPYAAGDSAAGSGGSGIIAIRYLI